MHMGRDMEYDGTAQAALCVRASLRQSMRLAVDHAGLRLTDSEGYSFTLTPAGRLERNGRLFLRYEVDRGSACERIRYSDPAYYLVLEVPIRYDGKKHTIVIPRINPVVKPIIDNRYDSLPGALVPPVLFLLAALGVVLVGRLILSARRSRTES
jgi:hypothetical protein